jgi:hypothetical protein
MQMMETLVDNTEVLFQGINFRQVWKLAKMNPSEKEKINNRQSSLL